MPYQRGGAIGIDLAKLTRDGQINILSKEKEVYKIKGKNLYVLEREIIHTVERVFTLLTWV